MKIIIEHTEESGWIVCHDNKVADKLGWEEMLGLITSITMPEKRPCLQWLKTEEQLRAYENYLKNIQEKYIE